MGLGLRPSDQEHAEADDQHTGDPQGRDLLAEDEPGYAEYQHLGEAERRVGHAEVDRERVMSQKKVATP